MMKKTLKILTTTILVMLLIIVTSVIVSANSEKNITVMVDGQQVVFDVQPTIINGRTMVPLRAIFESLGASVEWDQSSKTVMSTRAGTTIKLMVGNNTMYVNGTAKTLDETAIVIDGRTLVPVRAISEAFGTSVEWDGNNRIVSIATNVKSNVVYDANGIKITYKDYEVNLYEWTAVKVNFLIENNSSENVTVQVRDESINGYMIEGIMSDDIAPGKKMNADLTFHGSELQANGVSSVENIEFCFFFWMKGNKDDIKTKPIRITPDGVTSENITPKVTPSTAITPIIPAISQNAEVSYKDFVDFVKTNGSYNENKYDIQAEIPYYSSEKGASYGSVSLVYDPSIDELQVQVIEFYESNKDNTITTQFLTIDLPQKSSVYDWQFQYSIDYPYYKNNYDYFMAAEGTLKSNIDSYLSGNAITTTNVFMGKEIVEGSAKSNVGMLLTWIPIYGNKMFSECGSSLSFDYFGIK